MNEVSLTVPLATLIGVGNDAIAGSLKTPKLCLLGEDVALSDNTTLAELEAAKATYAGYVEGALVWSAVTQSDAGEIEYLGGAPEFRPTDATISNMIRGAYVKNMAGDNWLCACRFDGPGLPMQSALDSIRLTVRYRPDGNSVINVIS